MPSAIPVFSPGDHFVTEDLDHEQRLWRVSDSGLAKIIGWRDDVTNDEPDTVSVAEAAKLLRVSQRTIYARIATGAIESEKVNGARRIPRRALNRGD